MNTPGHIDFYTVVLFIHITAAVAAFGVLFAYPVVDQVIRRVSPAALPAVHEAQIQVGRRVVTPAAIVVLIAGLYLAIDRWTDFSGAWYSAAGVIIIVLLGIEHSLLIPNARRLRDQAAKDVGAGAATATLGAEYEQLARQRALFGGVSSLLVVVAIFLMVVKPGV